MVVQGWVGSSICGFAGKPLRAGGPGDRIATRPRPTRSIRTKPFGLQPQFVTLRALRQHCRQSPRPVSMNKAATYPGRFTGKTRNLVSFARALRRLPFALKSCLQTSAAILWKRSSQLTALGGGCKIRQLAILEGRTCPNPGQSLR